LFGHAAATGVVQAPIPSQVLAGVSMSLMQEAPGQVEAVPAAVSLQAVGPVPVPLHVPSLPHGGAATQRESAPLAGMVPQVPLARPVRAMLQAWQVLPHATLQQKPSTQLPPLHCAPMVHAWPTGVSVQVPAVTSHALPLTQSPSAAQVVLHDIVVVLQFRVPHDVVVPAVQVAVMLLQVPAVVCMKDIPLPVQEAAPQEAGVGVGQVSVPLQVAAGITDVKSVEQAALRHVCVLPHFAHTPPAAHAPVLPQFMPLAAGHVPSTFPAASAVHVPIEPARLQAWQVPEQALLQHTPSTQLAAVETQSAALLHMAPCACFVPHTWVTVLQVTPAQSPSLSQVVRHWVAFRHL
jgi:hypothetical protein